MNLPGASYVADEEDENHAPLAGFIRGVSRSLRVGVKAVTKGRIPVKGLAKVSDLASKLVDVKETHLPHAQELMKEHSSGNVATRTIASRFAVGLFKNVVSGPALKRTDPEVTLSPNPNPNPNPKYVGMVVFETYDAIIEAGERSLGTGALPLYTHFTVGLLAGVAHAITTAALDLGTRRFGAAASAESRQRLTYSSMHHGIAHGILFGSYESFKRSYDLTRCASA